MQVTAITRSSPSREVDSGPRQVGEPAQEDGDQQQGRPPRSRRALMETRHHQRQHRQQQDATGAVAGGKLGPGAEAFTACRVPEAPGVLSRLLAGRAFCVPGRPDASRAGAACQVAPPLRRVVAPRPGLAAFGIRSSSPWPDGLPTTSRFRQIYGQPPEPWSGDHSAAGRAADPQRPPGLSLAHAPASVGSHMPADRQPDGVLPMARRTDRIGHDRQPQQAPRPRLPVQRDLRRAAGRLGLRPARRRAEEQRQAAVVEVDGAAAATTSSASTPVGHPGPRGLGGQRPRRPSSSTR